LRVTIKDVEPVLVALRSAGLKPVVVGSLARQGWSSHDADIRVGFWDDGKTIYEDPSDIPGIKAYTGVLRKLGFAHSGEGTFERGDEEGSGSEVEEWRKGDLVVDIFPKLIEDRREWSQFGDSPPRRSSRVLRRRKLAGANGLQGTRK
jgi:hypothetical protein